MNNYKKYNELENIEVGDVISLYKDTNLIILSDNKIDKKGNSIIGICKSINEDNTINICTNGVIDVNVTGIICIGDILMISNKQGKAQCMPYPTHDKTAFSIKSIGKVIGVYDVYNKAKVLLNID